MHGMKKVYKENLGERAHTSSLNDTLMQLDVLRKKKTIVGRLCPG